LRPRLLFDEPPDGTAHGALVERRHQAAVRGHAPGDADAAAPGREKHRRLGRLKQIVHARALLPPDLEHVLEAGGGEEPDARAAPREHRIGRNGRAVHEPRYRAGLDAARVGERRDAVAHRGDRIAVPRRNLGRDDAGARSRDHVREGAADVDREMNGLVTVSHGHLPQAKR